jgi:diguanylate cyclase (GGDEF)-like protein
VRRQVEFISNLYLVDATHVIQCNIRDITARKQAEVVIQQANESLSSLVTALRRRDVEMTELTRMNDLLQTCETQEEAYRVIAINVANLFAGRSGCLAVLNSSGQFLETVARWGNDPLVLDDFPLEDCWALRRGRPHEVFDPKASLLCNHFVRTPEGGHRCLPLTVQGETLGIFCLDVERGVRDDQPGGQHHLAITVGEAIKLSLANLKLRKKLQDQATRDPLTGLFNRRYLEDTLPRELHRANRTAASLCVAMIDLDHFKAFNDTFGHEAGDLALRESSRILRENLRKSDIACRYGGEEFLLVMPDSSLEDTRLRLEQIRVRFEAMEIRHDGQLLATVTFSAGLAVFPEQGATQEEILRAADDALYVAKQEGRNRIVMAGGRA